MVECQNTTICYEEIKAYVEQPAGFPLIVGVDSQKDYRNILDRLFDDPDMCVVRMSDYCDSEFPPNPNLHIGAMRKKLGTKTLVWLGAAQSTMLKNQNAVKEFLTNLAGSSIGGHMVVLCPFCCPVLAQLSQKYSKLGHWVVLLHSDEKDLLPISLYSDAESCIDPRPVLGMKALVRDLEDLKELRVIPFVSACDPKWLAESMFPVAAGGTPYTMLCKVDSNFIAFTCEDDGTTQQWQLLLRKLCEQKTFSALCNERLGEIKLLPTVFPDFFCNCDGTEDQFICFIALKMFCAAGNSYLSKCIKQCHRTEDVLPKIYDTILEVKTSNQYFQKWMKERRRILHMFDENSALMKDYCERATIYAKDILNYLGDDTEEERAALIHALCCYDYTEAELLTILPRVAPALSTYLKPFLFDEFNTKLLDSDAYVRDLLTSYFHQYKIQKITNRTNADFIKIVEDEATRRSFTKLQTRSSVLKKMDKANVQPYFFDALGVEFLAYIKSKCEEYGMIFDCQIACCNLPSITCKNKEFYDVFPPDTILKEEGLDDLKHHGSKYDYRTTTEPLHIFDELSILAHDLKKMASHLGTGKYTKIVILSDHGASRLAVTFQSENKKLELEEVGKHSGRCCPVAADPGIPFASFEDGFAVLANYERFKGSRKADVETHGGASLEEAVVPIITLTAKPKEQQAFFTEDAVKCSPKDGAAIVLYVNPPLAVPRMVVGEMSYDGRFVGDKHNVQFVMSDIKRKGSHTAEIFDGNKKISVLTFDTIRSTKSVDML